MKVIYENRACQLFIAKNFVFRSNVHCDFESDTVYYAIRRFIRRSEIMRKNFTFESWRLRLAKGKARGCRRYTYVLPAFLLELPGEWTRMEITIDAVGVTIRKLELLDEYPFIKKESVGSEYTSLKAG